MSLVCPQCCCPVAGESARILVAESPTKPGRWGAAKCNQCGHFTSLFDTEGLEYAPADDPRWMPLVKSPANDFKSSKDSAGAKAWIAEAIRVGRQWAKKKRGEA